MVSQARSSLARARTSLMSLAAVCSLSASVMAQTGSSGGRGASGWDDPEDVRRGASESGGPVVIGARLGFGPAITGPADDPAEAPSLLYGTAFTGNVLAFHGVFRYRFHENVAFRGELGFTRSRVTGFAEDETFRRELTFKLMTLGLPLLIEGGHDLGAVRFWGNAGVLPRFGVAARAEEIRAGAVGNEPPIAIRAGIGMGIVLGAGVGIDVGRATIPLEVRYTRNVAYPGNTEARYDNYESPEAPGRYLVETRWDLLVMAGFDFALGGEMSAREPREPRDPAAVREPRQRRPRNAETVVVPPPLIIPPTLPPPMPAQPDQDGDGVSDRLDACPIEPANPSDNPSFPGCPPGGGIIQLSCERLYIGAPIDFESGSDVIQAGSYPLLYLLADALELADNVRLLRIEGHTDDRGSADANQRLSEDRAFAVMQFLTDLGIDTARIEAVGLGEESPIADNETELGRQENRRVEFHIVQNTTCQW